MKPATHNNITFGAYAALAAHRILARHNPGHYCAECPLTPGIIHEAIDLCWKAAPFAETPDGDIAMYLIPKGVLHRLVGELQAAGYPAALRNIPNEPGNHE